MSFASLFLALTKLWLNRARDSREMNTPKTFQLGWALFAGCFLTGGAIGYGKAMDGHVERAAALPNQVKQRDEALDKLEAKWRSEGKLKAKSSSSGGGSTPPISKEQTPPKPPS